MGDIGKDMLSKMWSAGVRINKFQGALGDNFASKAIRVAIVQWDVVIRIIRRTSVKMADQVIDFSRTYKRVVGTYT